jgi:hypothetical protein
VSAQGLYYIVPGGGRPAKFEYAEWWLKAIRIDRATAAVDTGKLDKHGKRIRGSKGEMQGGDTIQQAWYKPAQVYWDENDGCWAFHPEDSTDGVFDLYASASDELEIVTDEQPTPPAADGDKE